MSELDLAAFAIGAGTGASIVALVLGAIIARYVMPCGLERCPHHGTRSPIHRTH